MKINNKIIHLVETMITCHDNRDFDKLKSVMDKATLETKSTFFTQDRFNEVSARIQKNLGYYKSIEYMGYLNIENTINTIWKTKYSNKNDDTLWQVRINCDKKNPKIIRMTIN